MVTGVLVESEIGKDEEFIDCSSPLKRDRHHTCILWKLQCSTCWTMCHGITSHTINSNHTS